MSTDEEILVTDNMKLAYKIAWKYYEKFKFKIELEELEAIAFLRLNKSSSKF